MSTRWVVVILLLHASCAAQVAKVHTAALPSERLFYDLCTKDETPNAAHLTPGQRSIFCACSARLFVERVPPELATKSGLSAEELGRIREAGRSAGDDCAPSVQATQSQCMTSLVAVAPDQRAEACDCYLAGLVAEFTPRELVAMGQKKSSSVPNAQARSDATYKRCATGGGPSEGLAIGLAIATTVLSAGAMAAGIATATNTPETKVYYLGDGD